MNIYLAARYDMDEPSTVLGAFSSRDMAEACVLSQTETVYVCDDPAIAGERAGKQLRRWELEHYIAKPFWNDFREVGLAPVPAEDDVWQSPFGWLRTYYIEEIELRGFCDDQR